MAKLALKLSKLQVSVDFRQRFVINSQAFWNARRKPYKFKFLILSICFLDLRENFYYFLKNNKISPYAATLLQSLPCWTSIPPANARIHFRPEMEIHYFLTKTRIRHFQTFMVKVTSCEVTLWFLRNVILIYPYML